MASLILTFFFLASFSSQARAQWQFSSDGGKSSIKFGVLLQPQAEWVGIGQTPTETSQNVYVRRARILIGATLNEHLSFFLETDNPNFGKQVTATNTDLKQENLFIQDVIVTWTSSSVFQVDMGKMLLPLSHNHQQGAGTLLPVDYGPYTFCATAHTDSHVGRDYGFQLRGYPLNKHLEYRLGVFQGVRGQNATNPLRTIARVVWYPFDAETGFFYSGTSFGTKRILAFGGSFDKQRDYKTYSLDAYWDWPAAVQGDAFTAQLDCMHSQPDPLFRTATLNKQKTWLAEGGYFFHVVRLEPFVQYGLADFVDPGLADTSQLLFGLAWWGNGHKLNLKFSAGQQHVANTATTSASNHAYVVAQLQLHPW
jgi:hypothetical protein